jgi:hypothetical protein
MRRDLVSVRNPDRVLGSVVVDGDFVQWDGAAGNVMAGLIRELGERPAATLVMQQGWANGAVLYLEEARPGR